MENQNLLSPKVDFVFKKLFGNEHYPNILIAFLNAVLEADDPITSVQLKETTFERDSLEDKQSRLDIYALTNKDEQINIEIQVRNEYNIVKRSLYYWAEMHNKSLKRSEPYSALKRTICINLINFNYLPNEHFHSVYQIREDKTNHLLDSSFEMHFIELKKMKKQTVDFSNYTKLESWVEFINHPESEVIMKFEEIEPALAAAKAELTRLSADPALRDEYEFREKELRDKISSYDHALTQGYQQGHELGHALGHKIGLYEGHAKGHAQGLNQGLDEGCTQARIAIAKNLLASGVANDIIMDATGLTLEEIEAL